MYALPPNIILCLRVHWSLVGGTDVDTSPTICLHIRRLIGRVSCQWIEIGLFGAKSSDTGTHAFVGIFERLLLSGLAEGAYKKEREVFHNDG